MADGLQHAHSKGVIHRAIKPSNLILDGDCRLRILDFGLARLEGHESLTISGDVVGTPLYMSPEQARRRKIPVDHRTDIYSLGATLYEALTGRPPFRGKDHADTLSQIIERDPAEPRRLNPRVPAELETIVLKCLRKETSDRYRTAEALAQDLRRFVRGDPVEAGPEAPVSRLGRNLWRHRVLVSSVALSLLLLAMAGSIWSYRTDRATRLRRELYERAVLGAVMKIELARDLQSHVALKTLYGVGTPFASLVGSSSDSGNPDDSQAGTTGWSRAAKSAVAGLREAMELVPEPIDASYHLARALRILGKDDEARAILDESLRSDPDFLPARILREEMREQSAKAGRGEAETAPPTGTGRSGWAEHWLEARRAVRQTHWRLAAESYAAILEEISPDDVPYLGLYMETRLGRGRARLRLRDYNGAIEDFAAARERWLRLVEPDLLLAEAYWRRGDTERAEQLFDALSRRPGSSPDEVAVGVTAVFRTLREWEKGLEWAERIETPAVREARRVDFLRRLGRPDEAREAAERAIRHDPGEAYLYYELGVILDSLKRFEDAVNAFGEALERDGDLLAACDARSRARARAGDIKGALADCRTILKRDPDGVNAALLHHSHLPRIWSSGDPDTALATWEEVIRLDPEHPWNYVCRGDVHLQKGDREMARSDYTTALEMQTKYECFRPPLVAYAYAQRGLAWFQEAEHRKAIDDYTRAIELALIPTDANPDPKPQAAFYSYRGLSKERLGNFDGALEDYATAFELDPKNLEPLCFSGNVRMRQGDLEGAIADHEKVIDLNVFLRPYPLCSLPGNRPRGVDRAWRGGHAGTVPEVGEGLRRTAERRWNAPRTHRRRRIHRGGRHGIIWSGRP